MTEPGVITATNLARCYAADGNLTQGDRWTYTWDAENRLTSMTTTSAAVGAGAPNQQLTFQYDYLGRRVRKTLSTWNGSAYAVTSDTVFLYDGVAKGVMLYL
jgi:YD repeat-containing protein